MILEVANLGAVHGIDRDLDQPRLHADVGRRRRSVIVGRVGHRRDVEREQVRRLVRSTPLFSVSPSSCTWNVTLLYDVPKALAAGVNTSMPPVISQRNELAGGDCHAVVLQRSRSRQRRDLTAFRLLAGLSERIAEAKVRRANV